MPLPLKLSNNIPLLFSSVDLEEDHRALILNEIKTELKQELEDAFLQFKLEGSRSVVIVSDKLFDSLVTSLPQLGTTASFLYVPQYKMTITKREVAENSSFLDDLLEA